MHEFERRAVFNHYHVAANFTDPIAKRYHFSQYRASRKHPRYSDGDDPRQRDHQKRTRAFEALLVTFGHTVAPEALGERFTEATSGSWVTPGERAVPLGVAQAAGMQADEDGTFEAVDTVP